VNKINAFTLVFARVSEICSESFVSNGEEAGVITLKTTAVKDSNLYRFYAKKKPIRIRTIKTRINNNNNNNLKEQM